ncbi:MAG: 1-acyl-sn-glycerol-3-phosphate acyltransferase [Epulopiscium sp.]|nr:1-acyl-sn-glycerol-3-phosphate acyltransferase [Candidatus Epulonipiscium sp.]
MRSFFCILYICIHRFFSLFFMVKFVYLKKYGTREKQLQYAYSWLQTLSKGIMFFSGAKLSVKGKENIPENQSVLFVGNHKSIFDIPILVSIINVPISFIGKIQLKKTPIVSFWMKETNCIFMDRNDIRQSLKSITEGIELLKKGQSLLIFPEGTRIIGEEIGEFKKGSLKLATKSNVPIIPVYVGNSYRILETQFPWVKARDITVNIGEPIVLDELKVEDKKDLAGYVKDKVEALRN